MTGEHRSPQGSEGRSHGLSWVLLLAGDGEFEWTQGLVHALAGMGIAATIRCCPLSGELRRNSRGADIVLLESLDIGPSLLGALPEHTPVVLLDGQDGCQPRDMQKMRHLVDHGIDVLHAGPGRVQDMAVSLYAIFRRNHNMDAAVDSLRRATGHLDPLTGQPSRGQFLRDLDTLIAASSRNGENCATFIVDIKRFYAFNLRYGARLGDRLLHTLASHLHAGIRRSDYIGRIGDDSFGLAMQTGTRNDAPAVTGEKVLALARNARRIDKTDYDVDFVVAGACYPRDAGNAETLLAKAERAIRHAKETGKQLFLYDPAVIREGSPAGTETNSELLSALSLAIGNHEFDIHLQPLIDMDTNRTRGFEGLLRWQRPGHGLVFPDQFIPTAEQYGLMKELTCCALDDGLGKLARLRQLYPDLTLSINLSASSLSDREIVDIIQNMLGKHDLPPRALILELTETGIISDMIAATGTLQLISSLGVEIAIDDFGAGYASLSYLRKLPVSEVKIDKGFTMQMLSSPHDAVIVRSIIELGSSLNLRIVAEGIEDAETYAAVARMKCNLGQGYYMARPMAFDNLRLWMEESPFGRKATRPVDS